MFKIPQDSKQYTQDNTSDRGGNVHITKNINFDDSGYLKLSDRTRSIGDNSVLTNLNTGSVAVSAIANYDSSLFIIANKNIYYSESSSIYTDNILTWTQDAETGVPTLDILSNDMISLKYDGSDALLVANDSSNLYLRNASSWTALSLDSVANTLCLFDSQSAVAFSSGNKVSLIPTDGSSTSSSIVLTLPDQYTVTSMAYNNERLYIATSNSKGTGTLMFVWDGTSAEYNSSHFVKAGYILSVDTYKNGAVFVDSNADVWYCYGGLQQITSFPRPNNDKRQLTSNAVGPRGLITDNENIYISLNTKYSILEDQSASWESDLPSGVWAYNPVNNLHLKYTIGSAQQLDTNPIATSAVATATDIITVAGQTVPVSGTPCFYFRGSGTAITGLESSKRYFTIYVSDTTLKLATTHANAIAGTAIDITGTGNNAQFITFNGNNDFGGTYNRYGCIALTKNITMLDKVSSATINDILIGGVVQSGTNTSATISGLFASQRYQENRGYWITPKMESSNILDKYTTLVKKFKPLVNAEDKIVVKYRVTPNVLPNTSDDNITWVNSTSFTSTSDLSNVVVGNEVELISGVGAGYLAHITAITESTGTYTVTIDETVYGVSANDRAVAIFANWVKLGVATVDSETNDYGYREFSIDKNAKWIQFKFELRGIEITEEELLVDNQNHLPVFDQGQNR